MNSIVEGICIIAYMCISEVPKKIGLSIYQGLQYVNDNTGFSDYKWHNRVVKTMNHTLHISLLLEFVKGIVLVSML